MRDLVYVCAVCGQKLTTREDHVSDVSVNWFHGTRADHDPVPAPAREESVIHLCDVCSDVRPTWQITCRYGFVLNYTMPDGTEYIRNDDGTWRTCTACMRLVKRGDVEGLVHRALMTLRRRPEWHSAMEAAARSEVRDFIGAFFAARPGKPKRVSDQ